MTRLRAFRLAHLGWLVGVCALTGTSYYLIAVGGAQRPLADIPEYRHTSAAFLLFSGFGVLAFCRTAGRYVKWEEEHSPEARFVRRVSFGLQNGPYPLWVHTALAAVVGVAFVVGGLVVALNLM